MFASEVDSLRYCCYFRCRFAMAMRRVWDLCVHFARECSVELERDPSQQAWLGCLALALRTKQMITSRLHVEASQLTQLLACSQRHL